MTAPIILADLADLCTGLMEEHDRLLKEAEGTYPQRAIALAYRAAGTHDAVTAVLAFIAARAEKATA